MPAVPEPLIVWILSGTAVVDEREFGGPWQANLVLGRLAREAGVSEFHFCRLFKKTTGFAPSRYFIRMRMEKARRLLRETTKSVIEVGLDVGYSSPSHFAHIFRREVGVAPSDYRGHV